MKGARTKKSPAWVIFLFSFYLFILAKIIPAAIAQTTPETVQEIIVIIEIGKVL
jgi:hypothetical protein